MAETTFDLPAVGVTAAFKPCVECYELIEREALVLHGKPQIRPGARYECHACRNVLQATILNKSAEPVLDRFRPFAQDSTYHRLADVLFSTLSFSEADAKMWLEAHDMKDFVAKARDARERNFMLFSNDEKAVVDVYVPLDKGVFGRCASIAHKVSAGR